ncbi:dystrobrevin alpha [Phyllostomus discolor]|uniref:Dystrobrevin alpha n=1 Tax=Phyllostomus discolor TaxID=89673 RepID=A0A833Z7E6_9CHIR|nr:dystrobrevin alpha [Phyllostomus discolor]
MAFGVFLGKQINDLHCLSRPRGQALLAPPPATPSAGPSPCPCGPPLPAPPRLTRLRTRSQGSGEMYRRRLHRGSRRNLRNDLLVAADSITNTMSSLVKELNSEVGSETESNVDSEFGRTQFEDLVPSPTSEKAFLAQIHARKPGYIHGGATPSTMRTDVVTEDGDPYVQPEDENYENDSVRQLENELKMEEYLKQKLQDEAYQVSLQG